MQEKKQDLQYLWVSSPTIESCKAQVFGKLQIQPMPAVERLGLFINIYEKKRKKKKRRNISYINIKYNIIKLQYSYKYYIDVDANTPNKQKIKTK